jgi:hypothetical protein
VRWTYGAICWKGDGFVGGACRDRSKEGKKKVARKSAVEVPERDQSVVDRAREYDERLLTRAKVSDTLGEWKRPSSTTLESLETAMLRLRRSESLVRPCRGRSSTVFFPSVIVQASLCHRR